jgi:small subunit ribosomal protein S9
MTVISSHQKNIYQAVGRRKESTANVKLTAGNGLFLVNQKPVESYFHCSSEYLNKLKAPLLALGLESKYDISVVTRGGGLHGQMDAVRLGIARALCSISIDQRPPLKKEGYLTRDPRSKERKKYGLRKARKAPQFSKR